MKQQRKYKPDDVLTIAEAAAIYAKRDWRVEDSSTESIKAGVRRAEDRARGVIEYAVENQQLATVDDDRKTVRFDALLSWVLKKTPRGKAIQWTGEFAKTPWPQRFHGLCEEAPVIVQGLSFEVEYRYTLLEPVPAPKVPAPEAWGQALDLANFQINILQERLAAIESGTIEPLRAEVHKLKLAKAGAKGQHAREIEDRERILADLRAEVRRLKASAK